VVGHRIPSERLLATSLGVGRSAVREAIKPLQLLGLLEARVGDGTYLKEADSAVLPKVIEWGLLLKADRMFELVETRRYIEVALAGLAAVRRDAGSLTRIEGHLNAMQAGIEEWRQFVEADIAFHLEIAEAANNTVLSGILANLRLLLRVWIERVLQAAGETASFHAQHVPIFEAIKTGNKAAAERAMGAHIDAVAAGLMLVRPATQVRSDVLAPPNVRIDQ
jgi:GntR family transcriptional repressor for pyruvate dehydrogenase complex